MVEQWFDHYGAPKEVHSDEDVRTRSDTGCCKRVLDALNVQVTTGVPYTHTSNRTCERQKRVLEQNLRILMKGVRPNHELSGTFLNWPYPQNTVQGGRPAWFFQTSFPEVYKSPVGDWVEHRQDLANLARGNLKHIRERELTRRNRTRRPATFKVGDLVLVHHW